MGDRAEGADSVSFCRWVFSRIYKMEDGYRIQAGDSSSWVKSANYNDSYSNFKKFMRIVFAYAGTLSMEEEAKKIPLKKLQIGDIFIKGQALGMLLWWWMSVRIKMGKRHFYWHRDIS